MSSTANFYNTNAAIKLLYTGGSMNGLVYYFPKATVELYAENDYVHILTAGKLQQNVLYTDISTTNPYGHSTATQLLDILNAWKREGSLDDPYQHDALARTRVVNTTPLFFSTFASSLEAQLYNTLVAGSGAVTWDANEAAAIFTLATGATSRAVYQSKQYLPSFSGISTIGIFSAVLRTVNPLTNNTVQLGLYEDAADKDPTGDACGSGVFFRLADGALSVVTRAYPGGVQTDTAIAQTAWNIDRLDGTGRSGFTLDPTKCNAYVVEICADCAGTIRFGVLNVNQIAYCHVVAGMNTTSTATIRHAILPVRLGSKNTGITSSGAVTRLYGVTVYAEGAMVGTPWDPFALYAISRTIDRGTGVGIQIKNPPNVKALISVRIAAGARCRNPVYLTGYQWVREQGGRHQIEIIQDPTLTGAVWTAIADSAVEYDVTSTATSGGSVVHSMYNRSNNADEQSDLIQLSPRLPMYAPINGTAGTVYSLTGVRYGVDITLTGLLQWVEQYG